MSSGFTFNNTGPCFQNIATGNGPQYNHNGLGTQNHYYGNTVDRGVLRTHETQKLSRDQFEIGIICALAIEYDAVVLLLDRSGSEDVPLPPRAMGDSNIYKIGRIGNHNVVLTRIPGMGKASAAGSAANLQISYPNLKLVLLVGICGGVPGSIPGVNEVILGDVVISKTIVQYDFGRRFPNHEFAIKDTIEDRPGRLSRDIRGLIASFDTDGERKSLQQTAGKYLKDLQIEASKMSHNFRYPGAAEDKLFAPNYQHRHREPQSCYICQVVRNSFCETAAQASCIDLGCDESNLIPRERLRAKRGSLDDTWCPEIHIGAMASGDTVMKSGEDRDRIAREHKVIAFEMEGAGAWDYVPCIVVKGVCDYADSHKNKKWQPYAAATAASVAKAILERYPLTDRSGIA
ncbi:nucleoside phosphorylase domain-containing protein [Nemania sp. FL0916]|nr:nucleoside phosphorylase domain-containing protein [Nemania sp. FL0916]